MGDRAIVHAYQPDAEPAQSVVDKLRGGGVEILSNGPHMLLVSGKMAHVATVLGDIKGWKVSEETTTPPPQTRVSVKRPP
jgi:hypothetical protein